MTITNNIALEKLEAGNIAADGGVSTTFAALGRTVQKFCSDSCRAFAKRELCGTGEVEV